MKKTILTTFALLIILVFNCNALEVGYVNCDVLNVRVSPTTSSVIVTKLTKNSQIDIVYTVPGWYNIRLNSGLTGFVSAPYINKTLAQTQSGSNIAANIVSDANNYIGCKYVYGSSGPSTFDCSGFTTYIYKKQGISLPRRSRDQGEYGISVEKANLVAGDLVFFSNRSDRTINHVGIYIGNDNFIHASTSVRGVVVDSLSANYYSKNYVTARRVL